jgi:hypothetical protein
VYHLGSASLLQSELGHVSGVTMMGFALSVRAPLKTWLGHARRPCGRKCLAYRADARVAAANSVAEGREMVHANIFMSALSMNLLLYVPRKLLSVCSVPLSMW